MNLIYDFYLTVKTLDSKDYAKIAIEVDHDLTLEDLEEFVKEEGYDSIESYFKQWIDDEDCLNDTLNDVQNNKLFLVETAIIVYCRDEKSLCNFLTQKYQKQALQAYLEKQESTYLEL